MCETLLGANKKKVGHILKYKAHILNYLRPIFCGVKTGMKTTAVRNDKNRHPFLHQTLARNIRARSQTCPLFQKRAL